MQEATVENNRDESLFKKIELNAISPLNISGSTNPLFESNFIPVDLEEDAALYALGNLYGSWRSAVREYIANAETACKEAAKIISGYEPAVNIEIIPRENKFIIKDNGIGISKKVFLEVFRYYGRSRFGFDGTTSGKWGFGVKSYVMLTGTHGSMLIETKSRETDEAFSVYARQKGYNVLPCAPSEYGTAFTIVYKSDISVKDLIDAAEEIGRYVEVPVHLTLGEGAKDEKGKDIEKIDKKLISMHTIQSEIEPGHEKELAGTIPIIIKHELFEIYSNIVLRYGSYYSRHTDDYNIRNVGFHSKPRKENNVLLINMPIDTMDYGAKLHLSNLYVRIKREDGAQIPGTDIKLPTPTPDRDRLKEDELGRFERFIFQLIEEQIKNVYENVHTIEDFKALSLDFKNLIIADPDSFDDFQSAIVRELAQRYRFISRETMRDSDQRKKSDYRYTSLADILTNHDAVYYSKRKSVKKSVITRFLSMNPDAAIIVPKDKYLSEHAAALTGIVPFEKEASGIIEEVRESDLLTPSFSITYGEGPGGIEEKSMYLNQIEELGRNILVLRSSDKINPSTNISLRDPFASDWAVMKTKSSSQYEAIIKPQPAASGQVADSNSPMEGRFFTIEEAINTALKTSVPTNKGIMTLAEIKDRIDRKEDVILHHVPVKQEILLARVLANADFLYVPLSGNNYFLACLVFYDRIMEDMIKNTLFIHNHSIYDDCYGQKYVHADAEKPNLVIMEKDNEELHALEIIPRCVNEDRICEAVRTRDYLISKYGHLTCLKYAIITADDIGEKAADLAETNEIRIMKLSREKILKLRDTPYNILEKMHIPPDEIGLHDGYDTTWTPDALINMLIYAYMSLGKYVEMQKAFINIITEARHCSNNEIYRNEFSLHGNAISSNLNALLMNVGKLVERG